MADGGPPRSSVTPKVALQYSEMSKTPGNFQHIPKWSDLHPTIPQLYVPEWKTDMKNREVILRECKQAGLYYGPHDESLFLFACGAMNECKQAGLYYGPHDESLFLFASVSRLACTTGLTTRACSCLRVAGLYYGPHDESLFLCKRERLNHGEDRRRVETNYASQPDRRTLINPPRWSHLYRHRSTLMMFTDPGSD
uniref:Uncharacterized protein n=1 Tax=Branchiostoma floridae TaxID=7739 RepID=C3YGX9_BRAFL|eukprot:XP_002604439.1 hypothetical protein BRAFLDRAFT_79261 [Branchiostoma floridae]